MEAMGPDNETADEPAQREDLPRPTPPMEVRILVGFFSWMILGCLPIFTKPAGYDFLPSSEWVSSSRGFSIGVALVTLVVMLWIVVRFPQFKSESWFKRNFGHALMAALAFLSGMHATVILGPMAWALVAGDKVELSYTVARADGNGDRYCRSPVELQGLVYIFDEICRVPDDVRQQFRAGDRVIFSGHGSRFGMFATSVRSSDEPASQQPKSDPAPSWNDIR